jgi:hypothetical protein
MPRRFVGLADEPNTRCHEVGNPTDFTIVVRRFRSKKAALAWRRRREVTGFVVDVDDRGWNFGYTYTK